jgi:hypothetical protein
MYVFIINLQHCFWMLSYPFPCIDRIHLLLIFQKIMAPGGFRMCASRVVDEMLGVRHGP